MRLLDTETQKLTVFLESSRPRYAILSHTWEDDEVLFVDIIRQDRDWRQKAGAEKVLGSCQLARNQGFKHIWIDTCCIDKRSSAELSEGESCLPQLAWKLYANDQWTSAINSMFNWYMNAEICYVYLTDVAEDGSIAECRWFKRGWTLQELIAPTSVTFYDLKWQFINDKLSMSSELAIYTGIDELLLRCGHSLNPPLLKDHNMQGASEKYSGGCSCGRSCSFSRLSQLQDYCVAQKMSWASPRETTRAEDMAYCLMGLFEVNMALLYGEGLSRAFFRLQREILANNHDQSILAIDFPPRQEQKTALASHWNQFPDGGLIHFRPMLTRVLQGDTFYPMTTELTKYGVNVDLLIAPDVQSSDSTDEFWFGILVLQMGENPLARPAIALQPVTASYQSPVYCVRKEGLFIVSPEHPDRARRVQVRRFKNLAFVPDRTINTQMIRRMKLTILQNFDESGSSTNKESLPGPIHCVSNSPGCLPYSVECESRGRAILEKPGYPRLLVHTLAIESITGYISMIWILKDLYFSHDSVLDDAENAGQLLTKLKDHQVVRHFEKIGLIGTDGQLHLGSRMLVVRGLSDLAVEVKIKPVKFLDWTTPGVTVATTQIEAFEIQVLPQ